MRRPLSLLLIWMAAVPAFPHVGSPDIYYEGDAGPYRLFVTIRPPLVIPGVAEIQIRSESPDVRTIRIVPLRLTGPGSQYPPVPDIAQRSPSDPQFFTGSLWLMEFGSLQVRVEADGARGQGVLAVPVPAVAQRTLRMQRSLGLLLFLLMLALAASAVSIAGAAAREGMLAPGAEPGYQELRKGRRAAVVACLLIAGAIYLGDQWWDSEARVHAANVYHNPWLDVALKGQRLRLSLSEPGSPDFAGHRSRSWRSGPLIPDHGHLMHLFLIRTTGLDSFAHLHPRVASVAEGGRAAQGPADGTSTTTFVQDLPGMPPGHYKVLADIVRANGFPETLVGQVDLPRITGEPLEGDDATWSGPPLAPDASVSNVSLLPDGARMVWERPPGTLKANVPLEFCFQVEDASGQPVKDLEPYMGMAGHAEFVRSDLSVFAHVHPAGSAAMAAVEIAQSSLLAAPGVTAGSTTPSPVASMSMSMAPEHLPPEVTFPYGFPRPGDYRIFVQIKRSGRIETAVFDAQVR